MATKDPGEQLRQAIQAGNFASACALIPEFRVRLSHELSSATDDEDRRRKLESALDFMAESLHLARVIRAHISAKLRNVESLSRYDSPVREESRWSISA